MVLPHEGSVSSCRETVDTSLKVFPVSLSKSVVLCRATHGNASLLIHQLDVYFVCLLFVAGQVVNLVFSLSTWRLKTMQSKSGCGL